MKVLIIGSGLIGLTTAYALNGRGHVVTVIDRQSGPALETSFANGSLLTPSMSDPWNAPGSWRVLLGSLGRSDAPLQLRLGTLPSLAGWGARFLHNSRPARFRRNMLANLRLALFSARATHTFQERTGVSFGYRRSGSLKIFRETRALEQAFEAARLLAAQGLRFQRLTGAETLALEPALAPIADQLTGALYFESDAIGDAYRFCVGLAEYVREQGVELRFNTAVRSLESHEGQVSAIISEPQRFVADRYIVAAGSYSTPLLKQVGIHLPVRPAKGYSVTFANPPGQAILRTPVVDDHLHAAVVPLEGAVRVAGTAEFAGYDLSLNPDRVRNLQGLLGAVLPEFRFNPATSKAWCGLRSVSADGVPIIGPTPLSNLFVNTGHCHLGWTMAVGSAQLLADIISGSTSTLDPRPYALTRFSA